jgi:hypothetical protein
LTLKPVADADALMTGKLGKASGYNVSKVHFTHALKGQRIGQTSAALQTICLGDKVVGVYSLYDVMFSLTGCKAYGSLGYEPDDARAIATNIFLSASDR